MSEADAFTCDIIGRAESVAGERKGKMTVRSKRRSRAAIRELVRQLQEEGMKPGQECPISGQWAELNPHAPRAPRVEITAVKGKPLPATSRRGGRWVLVDATVHKATA